MNEALILERLDQLSGEVKSLKAEILQEVRQEIAELRTKQETFKAADSGAAAEAPAKLAAMIQSCDERYSKDKLEHLVRNLLASLEELSGVVTAVRAGTELTGDLVPVAQQIYPKTLAFFADMEGEFHIDEVTILLRKALTNLDTVGEGLDMLKACVELRDEMVPILQLLYPRIIRFLNSLHEGEFQAEKLGDLLHTILMNIHTLSDLLNMVQPVTELVKEVGVLLRETDVIQGVNTWLDGLQQGSGLIKLAGTLIAFLKKLDYNDKQIGEICHTIESVDLTNIKPVSMIGMVKQLNDPQVKQALGLIFLMLQTMGSCVQTYQRTPATKG